jgi:1-acyl-sn-glycerol-3-phosphate acyltransferase
MISLRSSLYFIVMSLTILVYGLPLALFGWAMPIALRNRFANSWASSNLFFMRTICGLRYRVRGREHLSQDAAIIMAKHQSAWETIALRAIVGGTQSWVLKRELMWIPVFGWAMRVMSPIAINRKAGRQAITQLLRDGKRLLDSGHSIMLFPEGTRTAPGATGKYNIGGALLAEHAEYRIIPIAHNAGVFWPRRSINKYPGTIDVVIGPAIDGKGKKAKEIIQDVENWIESVMAQLPATRESA